MPTRRRIPHLLLALCLTVTLAACDSATTDDGAGDGPGSTLGDGTVTITGDVEASIDGGAIFYFYDDGGFGLTIADADFSTIESDDDLPAEYLSVEVIGAALGTGTFSISDSTEVYVDYINENGINGSEDDDANSVSGTLSLTEVTDDRIVGTISAALVHGENSDEPNAQLEASFEAVLFGE